QRPQAADLANHRTALYRIHPHSRALDGRRRGLQPRKPPRHERDRNDQDGDINQTADEPLPSRVFPLNIHMMTRLLKMARRVPSRRNATSPYKYVCYGQMFRLRATRGVRLWDGSVR